jgi:hypothetical protein
MSAYISEFDKLSENPWRISWIADIEYPGSTSSEPLVAVCLSELKPTFHDPLSNDALPYNGRHETRWIKSGMIVLLKIGSVWINGVRARYLETFQRPPQRRSLTINPDEFEFANFGEQVEFGGRQQTLLGGRRYWVGDRFQRVKNTWTVLARSPSKDFEVLIIPCWTIFQHCMATSPRAVRRLLMGQLEKIIDVPECGPVDDADRTFFINIFKGFKNLEGKAIANLLADPVGRVEYQRMRQTMSLGRANAGLRNVSLDKSDISAARNESASNESPSQMKCGFPFSNPVTMTIVGKRLPFEVGGIKPRTAWGFLVTDFIDLSVQLVFDTLVIDRKNDRRKGKNSDDPDLLDAWGQPSAKLVDDPDDIELTSAVDDPDKALYMLYLEEKAGFDVPGYSFIYQEKDVQHYRGRVKKVDVTEGSDTATTGDLRGGEGDVVEADVESKQPSLKVPVTIEAFLHALNWLSEMDNNMTTLVVADVSGNGNPGNHAVNYLPTKIAGLRNWHLSVVGNELDIPDVGLAYVVAKVFSGGVWRYLIELERKGNYEFSVAYLRQQGGGLIDPLLIKRFMSRVAQKKGWNGAMENYQSWVFESIHHSLEKDGHAALARSIASKLQLKWDEKKLPEHLRLKKKKASKKSQ